MTDRGFEIPEAAEEAFYRLLATNVFLLEGDCWYLAEHHASLPLMERGDARDNERHLH